MDLEHICSNVFNSVCEVAKFGAVFYFSYVILYTGTVKLDSSSLVVCETLQL